MLVQLKVPEGDVRSLRDAVATFLAPSAPRAPRVTVDAARTYLAAHPKLLLENLRANPKLVADLMDEPEMDGVREASVLMAFDIISLPLPPAAGFRGGRDQTHLPSARRDMEGKPPRNPCRTSAPPASSTGRGPQRTPRILTSL